MRRVSDLRVCIDWFNVLLFVHIFTSASASCVILCGHAASLVLGNSFEGSRTR